MQHDVPEAPTMTPQEFRAAIEALFGGYGSQRAFARFTGVHETSIRRYIGGSRPIPSTVVLLLAYMQERKRMGLDVMIDLEQANGHLPGAEPQIAPTYADFYA